MWPAAQTAPLLVMLIEGVHGSHRAIDRAIRNLSEGWALDRQPAVDRNILRLAAFELMYVSDMPTAIVINEAIELAKTFGGAESGRFVNGILDRVRKDLDRPAREAVTKRDS